ncbi:hypothetical protein [Rhizobium hainanense]|uniref:Uncharacterized protein n=1 Tax=Rhizobium hainanense TaxID=52131 RepID=A0A1C3WIW4_9HYPH|nr:hypothetical protein [Rhizobium hainanense]SCB39890.1 hypothetical protein GA0061100_12115 [Rhizobium hainanense]
MEAFAREELGLWRWKHHDSPLLIDPCREKDYGRHLSVDLSGHLQDMSVMGRGTIDVYDLNRSQLVDARADAFRHYLSLLRSEFDRGVNLTAVDFATLEFGGCWYLLLKRLADDISRRIESRISTERKRIGEALRRVGEVNEAIGNLIHLQSRILDEMSALASPKAPYSAFAVAYIRDFKRRLGSTLPS